MKVSYQPAVSQGSDDVQDPIISGVLLRQIIKQEREPRDPQDYKAGQANHPQSERGQGLQGSPANHGGVEMFEEVYALHRSNLPSWQSFLNSEPIGAIQLFA